MGISPRRYLGDEPEVTERHYDPDGVLTGTTVRTVEPEWDAHNRAVVEAWIDWEADLHTCGRPTSEAFKVEGQPPPRYVVGERECLACKALDSFVDKHYKDGVPHHKQLQIYSAAEAQQIAQAQRE